MAERPPPSIEWESVTHRFALYASYPKRAIAAVDDLFPAWEHWKLM